MVEELKVGLESEARHGHRRPVVDLHAVVELARRHHVPVTLNLNEVIVEQIDEILEAEQRVASTFCRDDSQDVLVDLLHRVKELPLFREERFLPSSHLIILERVVVINDLRHVLHLLLVTLPVSRIVALDHLAQLLCGQPRQVLLDNIKTFNKPVVDLLEDADRLRIYLHPVHVVRLHEEDDYEAVALLEHLLEQEPRGWAHVMRIVDEDHERRLVYERVVHVTAFHPRVLHERVPIANFVLLTDEALDQLSQEVDQVFFLLFGVVWALHEADLSRDWSNLIDLSELLSKDGPALLRHDVLVDTGDLAHQVNLVQVSAADQNVSEEVLLFQAHSLTEVDEHHLNDRLPGI